MSLEQAAIATNRFGLGARPGEMQSVSGDPTGWLEAQITPERALPAPLAALPSTADDAAAFRKWTASIGVGAAAQAGGPGGIRRGVGMGRAGMAEPARTGSGMAAAGPSKLPPGMTVEGSFGQVLGARYVRAAGARFKTAVETDRPFFERWVRFWSNHFTVSAAKPSTVALPPSFERDVIRRHAAGRFSEMLLASCRHPGMLIYLDQVFSIGPNSPLAHNPQVLPAYVRDRMKGLNENLGREVLELHTLGVRSGYTQADVRAMALMLTGWSARQQDEGGGDLFRYVAYAHEPGPQTLLGKTYPDRGEEQAGQALVDLANHPASADHIATKLVRHFVADEPPPAAVARVSAAFRQSGGDLPTVARALVRSPEAWEERPRKFKPPEDYLISAQRALGADTLNDRAAVALLTKMGQRPNAAPGPDGWADVEAAWIGADPLWKRLEWATATAKGFASAQIDPAAIASSALGPQLTAETLHAIRAAESPAQGLAIFLVSPEFQRR